LIFIAGAGMTLGFGTFVKIQLPIMLVAMTFGVWLFYIQHNFAGMYWAHHDEIDRVRVAVEGSSFYNLPRVMRWFTASIGYHSLHHVRTRIPNYNLRECWENTPELNINKGLTMLKSIKSLRLHLWDDKNRQLVGWKAIRE
jgi:acyl-lipid omega-6 desaturase (Delta-12 desaturase)